MHPVVISSGQFNVKEITRKMVLNKAINTLSLFVSDLQSTLWYCITLLPEFKDKVNVKSLLAVIMPYTV